MKTKLIICTALLMTGCISVDQTGPTIDIIFGETLDLLTDAREMGDISDADWSQIKEIAIDANDVLDQWFESLESGATSSAYESRVRAYIRQLRGYLKEEDNG